MRLVDFSIRHALIFCLVWAFIIFWGIKAFLAIPVSFFPDENFITLNVSTTYNGYSKEIVFDRVTKPLEDSFFRYLSQVENIYSTTEAGMSSFTIEYQSNKAEIDAFEEVLLAFNQARPNMPSDVTIPVIESIRRRNSPLLTIAATSDLSEPELSNLAINVIKPHFEQIPEVAEAKIIGYRQKQATVLLDTQKMKERQISATDIVAQLKSFTNNVSINNPMSFAIQWPFSSLKDLERIPIHLISSGSVVTLHDLAEVREELTDPTTYAFYNGKPCILFEIYSAPYSSELTIEKAFPQKLRELNIPSVSFTYLFNREPNLIPMMDDFILNFCFATVIAIALIWLVFKDFQSVLVTFSSIPCSICGTFIVMNMMGLTINLYTILALIISVGLIIDDIIIVRENIFTYLEKGLSPLEATRHGVKEMIKPLVGTTCIILGIATTLLIITLSRSTQYLQDFGIVLFASLAFSLVEALTLAPILCAHFLKKTTRKHRNFDFAKYLSPIHRPLMISIIAAGLILVGVIISRKVPVDTEIDIPVGNIQIHETIATSPSLKTQLDRVSEISLELKKIYPEIQNIGLRVDKGQNTIFIQMLSKTGITPKEFAELLSKKWASMHSPYLEKYYIMNNIIPEIGYHARFGVELSSNNMDELSLYSDKLFDKFLEKHQFTNLVDSDHTLQHLLSFKMNNEWMSHLAVDASSFFNEMNTLLNGTEIHEIQIPFANKSGVWKSALAIKSTNSYQNFQEVEKTGFVPNFTHMPIPFQKISTTENTATKKSIKRKNREYLVEITGNIPKTAQISNPIDWIKQLTKKEVPLPQGISLGWTAGSKADQDLNALLPKFKNMNFLIFFVILVILFQSLTLPFTIFLAIPFAIIGSIFGLFIMHSPSNGLSQLGTMLAVGVAAKNAIVMLSFSLDRVAQGATPAEAAYEASVKRIRPILMTSIGLLLTTIPILISWNEYSAVQFPLGYAIIGGVIVAIFSSLFLVPVLFRYLYPLHRKISQFFHRL